MDITYLNGPASLAVPGVGIVKRGSVITVPADLGHKLCKQGWDQVNAPKGANGRKSKPDTNTTKEKK
jgi:hypothetical protein